MKLAIVCNTHSCLNLLVQIWVTNLSTVAIVYQTFPNYVLLDKKLHKKFKRVRSWTGVNSTGTSLYLTIISIIIYKLFLHVLSGHSMYLKFLVVLELLTNPVMHVFVGLLKKEVRGMRQYNENLLFLDEKGNMHAHIHAYLILSLLSFYFYHFHDYFSHFEFTVFSFLISLPPTFSSLAICYPRCSNRAFNRWMVAYTLIKNPSLQQLTASKLIESASVSDVPLLPWIIPITLKRFKLDW